MWKFPKYKKNLQDKVVHLSIYWAHLYWIPSGIVAKINSIISRFLLISTSSASKYHLCKWGGLNFLKEFGGWGFMDQRILGISLLTKSFWRALKGRGLWKDIIHDKYLSNIDTEL